MNRRGFTLLELLVVVAIVAVVSLGATVAFGNIEHQTANEELKNKYLDIQRAGYLYLDLHNDYLDHFMSEKVIYLKVGDLYNENYITEDLSNPVTGDEISQNYYIKIYIKGDVNDNNQTVNSCIVERKKNDSTGIIEEMYISDHLGNYKSIEASSCN